MSAQAENYPAGHSLFLLAKLVYENPPEHITVVLKDNLDLQRVKENIPFMANVKVMQESREYPLLDNRTTYYVCKNHSCLPPSNILEC